MKRVLLGIILILMALPGSFGITTIYSLIASIVFIICIVFLALFSKKELRINKFIFIILIIYTVQIVILNFLTISKINDYTQSIKYISAAIVVVLFVVTFISVFDKKSIEKILNYLVYLMALIGISVHFLFADYKNIAINENQITLMIFPALVFLLFSKKYNLYIKILIYVLGVYILFNVGGRTTAIVLSIIPVFIILLTRKETISKYLILLIVTFFSFVLLIEENSNLYFLFNDLLSDRLRIYQYFLSYSYRDNYEIFFGTGSIEGQVYYWRTINAHNSWLNYIFFQGLVGFGINFTILYYFLVKIKNFNLKYITLIAGILAIQMFETIFLFSMGYTSFLLSFLLIYQLNPPD